MPRQLVKQLEPYDIKPKQIRINSYDRMRGFEISQFDDAFRRYLANTDFIRDNVTNDHKPSNGAALAVTDSVTLSHIGNLYVTAEATNGAACHTVTDKTAIFGVGSNTPILDDVEIF